MTVLVPVKEIVPGITELPVNMSLQRIGEQCCVILDTNTGVTTPKIPLLGDRPRQIEAVMFAIGKLLEVRALRAQKAGQRVLEAKPEPVKRPRHLRVCTDADYELRHVLGLNHE